ncbi:hypothetical protein [Bacillus sp. FJAT-29814]|uniref:hypothetical protein n=1 Tax=Bacillus sp. FJAT-29814 TaxID=1729688 RepID=UPI000834C338|nr:hypothetical protein [Bacillus sp. FJAT-29814]
MSINIYQIHVQTDQLEKVNDFLNDWLKDSHRVQPVIYSSQNSHFPFFQKEQPSLFAVSPMHENWITIRHDSYEPPFELAEKLSSALDCTVIQAMGQSTVDTYYLSVHQAGKMIRKIHCGEDTIGTEYEGEPFPFEKINPDEHYFYYEEMDDFCQHFGFDVLIDPSENDGDWTIIKIKEKPIERNGLFSKLFRKH